METLIKRLKLDYESCQLPQVYNPQTLKIISRIAELIDSGESSFDEFVRLLKTQNMGVTERHLSESFGDACYRYIAAITDYLACKRSWC